MTHEDFPFGHDYWENRYAEPGYTWSGKPNPVLVAEAAGLPPGRALDIGSGEGGDALWLAARGWSVTGVDIAQNALDKARRRVEATDAVAATRIDWQQHDLAEWHPEPASFDLISSQFMHLPEPSRGSLFRALAAAVAPGGILLIVGHAATDADDSPHSSHLRELMFEASDVLEAIDGERLDVVIAEDRARPATPGHAHGNHASIVRDVVVKAMRPL